MDPASMDLAYTRCIGVSDFLRKIGPAAERVNEAQSSNDPHAWRKRSLFLLWARTVLQMRSLGRLGSTEDYQAIGSVTRCLFEICVDAIVLAHGDEETAMRHVLQGHSDRADYFRRLSRFFSEQGKSIPPHYRATHEQVARINEDYRAERLKYWPEAKGRHPKRDLVAAVRQADLVAPPALVITGLSLAEFYEIDYRFLSGLVHAGTAAFDGWEWSPIGSLVARCMLQSFAFALIITDMLVTVGGFGADAEQARRGIAELLAS